MEELIKYFEQVEARLAALEAAAQGRSDEEREAAQEQRIAELTALTATLSAKIVALEAKIVTLEARPATIVEKVVEKAVAPEKPEVPENVNEDENVDVNEDEDVNVNENVDVNVNEDEDEDEIKLDEETGEPELEVEFIEEEETAEPAATVGQPVEVVSSVVPRLEDIRKGISLADRFLFQRELFGGNGELMNKSIETINGLGSLSEAEAYIRTNFPDWNKESNAYELFTNLLKRRW